MLVSTVAAAILSFVGFFWTAISLLRCTDTHWFAASGILLCWNRALILRCWFSGARVCVFECVCGAGEILICLPVVCYPVCLPTVCACRVLPSTISLWCHWTYRQRWLPGSLDLDFGFLYCRRFGPCLWVLYVSVLLTPWLLS